MPSSESLNLVNQDKSPQSVPLSMTAEVNRKVAFEKGANYKKESTQVYNRRKVSSLRVNGLMPRMTVR